MSVCLVLLGVMIGCRPHASPQPTGEAPVAPLVIADRADRMAQERDRWLGEDKLRHLGVAFAATTMTYAGARTLLEPGPSRVFAATAASIASVGKELHDLRTGSGFSYRDLAWDAAGIALGLALATSSR